MAVLHDQLLIAGGEAHANHNDGKHTVGQRSASPQRHQRIHAGGAGFYTLPTREEEGAVNPADRQCQHQLGARKQDGVPAAAVEHTAQRQTNHMPHRDIHQRHQKAKAGNQALFQLGCLGVLQLGVFALRRGQGRAVSGGIHGVDDPFGRGVGVGVGGIVNLHRVGQQADRDRSHARHSRHSLFHMACAGRAAHAGDFIALHGEVLS